VGEDEVPERWERGSINDEGPARVAPCNMLVAGDIVSLKRVFSTRTEHVRIVLRGVHPHSPCGNEAFTALAALEVARLPARFINVDLSLLRNGFQLSRSDRILFQN